MPSADMPPTASRDLPATIAGYGTVTPYAGHCRVPATAVRAATHYRPLRPGRGKLVATLDDALAACDLADGAVLSFHHHLRNGDAVLNAVLDAAARRGLRGLTVAASSLFPVHAPLVDHVRRGVVARIVTSYAVGPVADAISAGLLPQPVVMQTHGGRAFAIESGRLRIDAAFVAAPAADAWGNVSSAVGPAACGPLGYARVDAEHAAHVVAVTDHLVPYPAHPIEIAQDRVDVIVELPSIGDAAGIESGTTRPTDDPLGLRIAATAADVVEAAGLLDDTFSFQTGAGGISLAVAERVGDAMRRHHVQGSFASGGITGTLCAMLEAGLFRTLFDVQCFDRRAVDSYRRDERHLGMSASTYANPASRGAVVDRLRAVVLGAAEVDLGFDVNVTTGADGRILGGSGGHADTADGAEVAIVTTRLATPRAAKIVERVRCVTTPGATVDVVVTEAGIAVNPRRPELRERLQAYGLPVRPIEALLDEARRLAPSPAPPTRGESPIVAVVEYRDGSVIDVVRAIPQPGSR